MRRLFAFLTACVVPAAVAGCGSASSSSSDIASQPPQAIVKSAVAAANGLKSVHAAGAVVSGGERIGLDLHLVDGVGGRGQITLNGLTFQLVGVGRYAYMQAPPQVWQKAGAPAAAARLLQGKWLRSRATGQFASIAQLTDIHRLFAQLLTPHGKLKTGAVSTFAGHKVVAVNSGQGTLYVAATGKPYPIALSKPGSDGGRITFDRFNEAVSVTAPADTIDLPGAG